MEACPCISETTFALTPSPKSSVALVCLRSWNRRFPRTPESALTGRKERLRRFDGLTGEPVSLAKTSPPVLPGPRQPHALLQLALAVVLEGRGRPWGEPHPPPLAGLGGRAHDPTAPVLAGR